MGRLTTMGCKPSKSSTQAQGQPDQRRRRSRDAGQLRSLPTMCYCKPSKSSKPHVGSDRLLHNQSKPDADTCAICVCEMTSAVEQRQLTIGHGAFEGYEYSVRLIVFSDEDGEALWRGEALTTGPAASDEPRFHICEA